MWLGNTPAPYTRVKLPDSCIKVEARLAGAKFLCGGKAFTRRGAKKVLEYPVFFCLAQGQGQYGGLAIFLKKGFYAELVKAK